MGIIELILLFIYAGMLLFILLYSFIQAHLVVNFLKRRHRKKSSSEVLSKEDINSWPHVTVQLPVYNERYVVKRLIDAVCAFDYPKEKLEIQVLDDSSDETVEIAAARIEEMHARGHDIVHVRRQNRQGFKAGALAYGLKRAKGEFIAIFDADFLPHPDFLLCTLAPFGDPQTGVVQTRWEHINRDFSLLTRLQAFGLDAHFSVEQAGRNENGYFINFNGTAGVWRRSCIEDAGGWESDTLTEDLDLSYRAQLKGWHFCFLEDVGAPAELPAAMNALKTQQFRWTKGAAECARKNLLKVFRAKELPLSTKVHALFHLMNSFVFICIITTALLSIPLMMMKEYVGDYAYLFKYGVVFLLSLFLLSVFYWVTVANEIKNKLRAFVEFAHYFPLFLSVSMGLSLHNAIAVLEGYAGRKTPFIRTPKFNIVTKGDSWKKNIYIGREIGVLTIIEGLLALYFAFGIVMAFVYKDFGLLPFHIMLTVGFGLVCFYTVEHSKYA